MNRPDRHLLRRAGARARCLRDREAARAGLHADDARRRRPRSSCCAARWPQARRVAVVCGAGNNGGDGYVLARLAQAAGLETLVLAADAARQARPAMRAAHRKNGWPRAGSAHPFAADALSGSDVIVDGLLGIGLPSAAPRPETLAVIRAINAAQRPVLALDIPSGVDADSGAVHEEAVRAEITLSFVGFKSGLFLGAGAEHAGVVLLDDLGVVAPALPKFAPLMRRIDEARDRRDAAAARARGAQGLERPRAGRRRRRRHAGRAAPGGRGGAARRRGPGDGGGRGREPGRGHGRASRAHLSTRVVGHQPGRGRCAPPTCSPSGPASAPATGRSGCGRRRCARGRRRRWSTPTR